MGKCHGDRKIQCSKNRLNELTKAKEIHSSMLHRHIVRIENEKSYKWCLTIGFDEIEDLNGFDSEYIFVLLSLLLLLVSLIWKLSVRAIDRKIVQFQMFFSLSSFYW